MENGQKNEIDQGLGAPDLIWNFSTEFTKESQWKIFKLK